MVARLAESTLKTQYGTYREYLYYDGKMQIPVLVMGEVKGQSEVLCRVHSACLYAHAFNSIECDCREQMAGSQQQIQQAGKGILIWMDQEGKGNGHLALMKSIPLKKAGLSQAQAYVEAGYQSDARDFSAAAKILQDLGVASISMLTGNPKKVETLTQFGVLVSSTQNPLG